jgi:uncharacterized protein YbaA (DUF1428 family)
MTYVDGFVLPVKKRQLARYRRMAKQAGKVWRQHGALEFRECVADDVPHGKRTSFPRSVKLKRGEIVVFSYIVYRSRAERDHVMKKVMKDKRIDTMMKSKTIPFDAKRMIFGGFKTMVDA